jgi:sulfide:quinone oxidoreductase
MEISKLNEAFSVAAQIGPKDIPVIAAMGFKSILCNRPDGESPDQPLFEAVEAGAKLLGLTAAYLPVRPAGPAASDAAEFGRLFASLPKPVLAYCQSGRRSRAIWDAGHGASVR